MTVIFANCNKKRERARVKKKQPAHCVSLSWNSSGSQVSESHRWSECECEWSECVRVWAWAEIAAWPELKWTELTDQLEMKWTETLKLKLKLKVLKWTCEPELKWLRLTCGQRSVSLSWNGSGSQLKWNEMNWPELKLWAWGSEKTKITIALFKIPSTIVTP